MLQNYITNPVQFDYTTLEKGQDILVVNHATWHEKGRGMLPPMSFEHRFYRFGILSDQPQTEENRTILPMAQHAWALKSAIHEIDDHTTPVWEVMRSPIVVLDRELQNGWLDNVRTRCDLPEECRREWNRRHGMCAHPEIVQSEEMKILAGAKVLMYFKEHRDWDFHREERTIGDGWKCYDEAHFCATKGLTPAQHKAEEERAAYTARSDLAQRIEEAYRCSPSELKPLLREAKELGLHRVSENYPSRDGLIITPAFLENLCVQHGILPPPERITT